MRLLLPIITALSIATVAVIHVSLPLVTAGQEPSPSAPGAIVEQEAFDRFRVAVRSPIDGIVTIVVERISDPAALHQVSLQLSAALQHELPAACYSDAWLAAWVLYGDLRHGPGDDQAAWLSLLDADLSAYLEVEVSAWDRCIGLVPTALP